MRGQGQGRQNPECQQRCGVHFMRNALVHTGKSGRRVVSAFIATAFAQDEAETARVQRRRVADQLRPKLPRLAAFLDEAETDVLAYVSFPAAHRAKLHSTDEMDKRFLVTEMTIAEIAASSFFWARFRSRASVGNITFLGCTVVSTMTGLSRTA